MVSSEDIYDLMKKYVEAGLAAKAIKKCNAIYNFSILDKPKGKEIFAFYVNVKKGGETAGRGLNDNADSTFIISDSDFVKMCMGKLNPQMAFIRRKLKIKGNFRKATSFTPDLFPKPTKANIDKYSKMVQKKL